MNKRAGINNYKMNIKILTPTFIGSGDTINKSQYIYDSQAKVIKVIDERKFAVQLSKYNLMDYYGQYVMNASKNKNNNKTGNDMNINQWLDQISRYTKIDPGFVNKCIKYTISTSHLAKNQLNDINTCIRDIEGKPYIPGSSIKGALVNCIISYYIHRNQKDFKPYWDDLKRFVNRPYIDKKSQNEINSVYKNITKSVLDYKREQNSFHGMSGLSISDTSAVSNQNIILMQKNDMSATNKGIAKKSLPIFREYLTEGAELSFTLTLDQYKLKEDLHLKTIDDLMEAVDYSYDLLVGDQGVYSVFDDLDNYLPYEPEKEGFIYLGGGAGYYSKTIMAALAPNKRELLEVVRKLIHKDNPKTFLHKNDKIISPRTLKLSSSKKEAVVGICKIKEVIKC